MRKVDTIKKSGGFRETIRHSISGRCTRKDAAIEPSFLFCKNVRFKAQIPEHISLPGYVSTVGTAESTEAGKIATAAFEAAFAAASKVLVVGMSDHDLGNTSSIESLGEVMPHYHRLQFRLPLDVAEPDPSEITEEELQKRQQAQFLRATMPIPPRTDTDRHPFIEALENPPEPSAELRAMVRNPRVQI